MALCTLRVPRGHRTVAHRTVLVCSFPMRLVPSGLMLLHLVNAFEVFCAATWLAFANRAPHSTRKQSAPPFANSSSTYSFSMPLKQVLTRKRCVNTGNNTPRSFSVALEGRCRALKTSYRPHCKAAPPAYHKLDISLFGVSPSSLECVTMTSKDITAKRWHLSIISVNSWYTACTTPID